MNAKILTTLLGLAILAVPAAVPASQPADTRLSDLKTPVQLTLSDLDLAVLLRDPREAAELRIVLPTGFTTLDIDQDPFAV